MKKPNGRSSPINQICFSCMDNCACACMYVCVCACVSARTCVCMCVKMKNTCRGSSLSIWMVSRESISTSSSFGIPSGIIRGMAATQVLSKSMFDFLCPLPASSKGTQSVTLNSWHHVPFLPFAYLNASSGARAAWKLVEIRGLPTLKSNCLRIPVNDWHNLCIEGHTYTSKHDNS